MAKMIMKDLLNKANINNVKVSSRGLSVFEQSPVNPHVKTILSNQNIKLSSHCSTLLSEDDFTDDTLLLTMTNSHKQMVKSHFPQADKQVFTLSEYVTGSHADIPDPYGGSIDIYTDCFLELSKLLNVLVKNLLTQ